MGEWQLYMIRIDLQLHSNKGKKSLYDVQIKCG